MTGHISGNGPDPIGKRREKVRQKLVLVVHVRRVALARQNVERRHNVVLTVRAKPERLRRNPDDDGSGGAAQQTEKQRTNERCASDE